MSAAPGGHTTCSIPYLLCKFHGDIPNDCQDSANLLLGCVNLGHPVYLLARRVTEYGVNRVCVAAYVCDWASVCMCLCVCGPTLTAVNLLHSRQHRKHAG